MAAENKQEAATLFMYLQSLIIALTAASTAIVPSTSDHVSSDGAVAPVVTVWPEARRVVRDNRSPELGGGAQPFTVFLSTNGEPDGDMPRDVAFTPDGTTVVIVNRDTDNLALFDVATRTVSAMVSIGDFPVDVAVTPDGRYAMTPNVFDNTVSVVDIAAERVAAHVPVTGDQPYRVAVTADGSRAIVGVINDGVTSSISVIDLDALEEVSTFPTTSQGVLGFFFSPESGISGSLFTQFALAADDTVVVLPDRGGGRVMLYDLADGTELASLSTAPLPTAVDVSADGDVAVVSHEGTERTITEINVITRQVTGSFATPDNLMAQVIRITPDESHAIAAISNNVIFVNLATGVTTATLSTGSVGDIELSFDGQFAFVSNFNARVIRIATQQIVRTIPFAACVDAATSPVEHRAVALNNRFQEDIQLYNIDGSGGFFEGRALTGTPPEGDATRVLAISPDGLTAVAANNTSRNVSIIDVADGTVRAYVDTGDRPLDVAITPDGAYAVVTNGDANSVSVIDLSTDIEVASLIVNTRPARVRIAPDGLTAYVLSVAASDRIHFIELDGAASAVTGAVVTGQTGSAQGYPFTEVSGIALSPDGSVLGVCESFDDRLLLIDTATRSVLTRVPVGDFPIRAVFSPTGSKAYVANAFGDSVSVVNVNGALSNLEATVPGIDMPLTMDVDPTGSFVYVGAAGANSSPLRVLSASTNAFVQSLLLSGVRPRATHLSASDSVLYLAGSSGSGSALIRVNAAGGSSSVIDTAPLTSAPSDMVFSASRQVAVTAEPIPDGVEFVSFGSPGDGDGDGDIDLFDFAAYLECVTGPVAQGMPPACAVFDFDDDDDIDFADLAGFQITIG